MGWLSKLIPNELKSAFSAVRDPLQTMAVLAGNYLLPGSSMLTSQLASQGAQRNLSSDVGMLAQMGTGYGGYSAGNTANYNQLGDWISGGLGLGQGGSTATSLGQGAIPGLDLSMGNVNLPGGVIPSGGSSMFSGGDVFDWQRWGKNLLNPQSLMSFYGGLQSLGAAGRTEDMAARYAQMAAPWDTSGGRALAGTQLQNLMQDPSQQAATDPAYQLRMQAAQRAMAPMGQGSGAMAVAAANASTDWLNQRMQQLGGLAGAGLNPAAAGQIGLQGLQQGADLRYQGYSDIAGGLYPQDPWSNLSLMGG